MTENANHPWYDRPNATINADGDLEIRASAARSCRRALWYTVTGVKITDPPTRQDRARMESGKMMEPVLIELMREEGWNIKHNSQLQPETCRIKMMPGVYVTGTWDAFGRAPEGQKPAKDSVIEVKVRGNAQYNNWSIRGAALATPDAVAQGAIYVWQMDPTGDLVIATMNRETMEWDTEQIANARLKAAMYDTVAWLAPLHERLKASGPNPELPPGRDFTMKNYQCQNCPFQTECYASEKKEAEPQGTRHTVSIEDATQALLDYEDAAVAIDEQTEKKTASMAVIAAWYESTEQGKMKLQGHKKARTISRVSYPSYQVSDKAVRELLTDEQKEEFVTEKEISYVRVS